MTWNAGKRSVDVTESAGEFVAEMVAADRSHGRLGIRDPKISEGKANAQLTVEPDMANGLGIAHGGFIFALADYVFACAANSLVPGVATTDTHMSFLAPARVGDVLKADAEVTFASGRRVIVDVTIQCESRAVALFRGTGRSTTRSE